MTARTVYFTAPREIDVREEPLPELGPQDVRVNADVSAISSGTELLLYRGEVSEALAADKTIEALDGALSFPLNYGYATAGTVTGVGEQVADEWMDTRVFAFHPHASRFVASVEDVLAIPPDIPMETAVLLPNIETAINLVLDGAPRFGERVAVFGQGVVGLLTTALLSRFPIDRLVTMDLYDRRRHLSESMGADASIDPRDRDPVAVIDDTRPLSPEDGPTGTATDIDRADLTFELSGNPNALDDAIDTTGYAGRVVVGSWYGTKTAELTLDGRFHRSRIQLISSQVSTIAPGLRGRWSKARRLQAAWRWLDEIELDSLITHRLPVGDAPEAYDLLDHRPEEAVQVLLTY